LGHGNGAKVEYAGDERDPVEEIEETDRLPLSCGPFLEIATGESGGHTREDQDLGAFESIRFTKEQYRTMPRNVMEIWIES
jgi:hypothetical protein